MKNKKIFIACPISKYLTQTGIDTDFESFIRVIYEFCKQFTENVFLALEREEYGKNKMYGSDCTVADYNEIQDTDILIAFPEDSMGVSVEIGWACALKKRIVVFVDKKYKQSELIKSINSVSEGVRYDIDTTLGYANEIEDIKSKINKYFTML